MKIQSNLVIRRHEVFIETHQDTVLENSEHVQNASILDQSLVDLMLSSQTEYAFVKV